MGLDDLMSFISQADGLVACSTGVLHLAAALNKFVVGLYSPMRPIHPGRWKPIGKNANYLVLDKDCNACRRSRECACVNEITVEQVRQKIENYQREPGTRKIDGAQPVLLTGPSNAIVK
jgi:ADP-heptose:LPS heptosyltransferase